jgi:uncharacterized membrane protein YkvA (DUF1232 family)
VQLLLVVGAGVGAGYAFLVLGLLAAGRRTEARALAGLIPDCAILLRGILRDECVPRRTKLLLVALLVYLALPVDLVPDFIPIAGQLDDAILVVLVLRRLLRSTDASLIAAYWPGPPSTRSLILRLAHGSTGGAPARLGQTEARA